MDGSPHSILPPYSPATNPIANILAIICRQKYFSTHPRLTQILQVPQVPQSTTMYRNYREVPKFTAIYRKYRIYCNYRANFNKLPQTSSTVNYLNFNFLHIYLPFY